MQEAELLELMGQRVIVLATFRRHKNLERQAKWEPHRLPKPRVGWVVGMRWLQQGHTVPGMGGGMWDEDGYDPPYFKETGPRTPCLLVSFWPTKAPVHVPLESWRKPRRDDPQEPDPGRYVWTEADREAARRDMEGAKRDEFGRFTG